jgi:cytochrome c oxidase cbb3-type subunit 4
MDSGTMHGIITIIAMLAFLAVCWWAYRPANKARFEADARMPLDTDPLFKPRAKETSGDK